MSSLNILPFLRGHKVCPLHLPRPQRPESSHCNPCSSVPDLGACSGRRPWLRRLSGLQAIPWLRLRPQLPRQQKNIPTSVHSPGHRLTLTRYFAFCFILWSCALSEFCPDNGGIIFLNQTLLLTYQATRCLNRHLIRLQSEMNDFRCPENLKSHKQGGPG